MKSPTHPVDGEYIKEWLILGPFCSSDLETDFLTDVGGEANIDPQEGDTVITEDGRELAWKRYQTKGNLINLSAFLGYPINVTVYATCVLQSQTAGDAQIRFGSRGRIAVWINNQRVHSHPGDGIITLDQFLFEVELKPGANRCLVKISQQAGNSRSGFALRAMMLPQTRAVISGVITDETGAIIPYVSVCLERNGFEIASTQTDTSGHYQINVYPVHGRYDLAATNGEKGDWQLDIRLHEGERRTLNLTLKETISIEGTLRMLDGTTPHIAVPVQAVRISDSGRVDEAILRPSANERIGEWANEQTSESANQRIDVSTPSPREISGNISRDKQNLHPISRGKEKKEGDSLSHGVKNNHILDPISRGERFTHEVATTTLSDENGGYRFINLKPGRYQVRCHTLNEYVYYGERESEKLCNTQHATHNTQSEQLPIEGEALLVEHGKTLKNIDFRFASFKKGVWKTYTHLDGLSDNRISQTTDTPDGAIWFGTQRGVSRYDGERFINFTQKDGLIENRVHAVYCASDESLWFCTSIGVSRLSGKGFANFTPEFTKEDGLRGDQFRAVHGTPDGSLWFGTDSSGVYRGVYPEGSEHSEGTDGKRFVHFMDKDGLAHYHVYAIYCAPDGDVWVGTIGGGVSRYDGESFVNLTQRDGLADNWVFAIYKDSSGVMWFGTRKGVSRYDGKTFVNFTKEDGLLDNNVHAIYQDAEGALWFGTGSERGNGGVSRYDGKGFTNFTTSDGLAGSLVTSIYQDDTGALWFGTRYWGVSRYDGRSFVTLTTEDGLTHNDVKTIHRASDGAIWVGTSRNGVSRYDGKEFINFTTREGLAHNEVWAIQSDPSGVMWFGTVGGVSRYDGKSFVNFTNEYGLPNNAVGAIHRDPSGVMWFGIWWGGLSRYDGKTVVNFTMEDGLPSNTINAIYHDPNGVLWLGTDGGISRYDGKTFFNIPTSQGLPYHYRVLAIARVSDETLWFGTHGGGVFRYDLSAEQAGGKLRAAKEFSETLVSFTMEDGLAHNWVTAIHRTPDGVIWFATFGGGVSQYDGVTWTSLDTRDGLAGDNISSIYQDSDGTLWFGTDKGITRYRRSAAPPKVRIVAVTTDGRYTDLDALGPVIAGARITFEYSSIDFKTHPQKRLYRYKLSGYDTDWNKPTRKTQIDYSELPPGEYIFQVQAIDRDLNYSEPAAVHLTVMPDPRDVAIAALQTEIDHLRREVGRKYYFENIVGRSAPMKQVYAMMEKAIDSGLAVLLSGETGTGKELVAKAIHHNSSRRNNPLLELNSGAVPRDLVASTLFGYRKGAFTGAQEDTIGLFEAASGGTVILDEIGEMPNEAQVHLLRALQERKIQRVGETRLREIDVRIIAITNRDLEADVKARRFREDLYYRLNVFPIHIPPLRERLDDIPLLAEHFLDKVSQEMGKQIDGFAEGVIEMLQSYAWPGNVRELENEIARACAFVEEGLNIQKYHFSSKLTHGESLIQDVLSEGTGYSEAVDRFRRRLIKQILDECGGNRHEAARRLGMQRSNLLELIKRLEIK